METFFQLVRSCGNDLRLTGVPSLSSGNTQKAKRATTTTKHWCRSGGQSFTLSACRQPDRLASVNRCLEYLHCFTASRSKNAKEPSRDSSGEVRRSPNTARHQAPDAWARLLNWGSKTTIVAFAVVDAVVIVVAVVNVVIFFVVHSPFCLNKLPFEYEIKWQRHELIKKVSNEDSSNKSIDNITAIWEWLYVDTGWGKNLLAVRDFIFLYSHCSLLSRYFTRCKIKIFSITRKSFFFMSEWCP